MSLEASRQNISEPNYYHREYKNDIGEKSEERSWRQQCQRVATVALPFFSLYKPLSLPISLGMGALRSWSCINQLLATIQEGNSKDIPYQLLQTTIAVVAFGGTIFAHPAGMLITTGHDLIIETVSLLGHLKDGEHQKALESCANLINNALYLALFSHGGLEIAIASFAMQVMLGLYHSHGEFKKGNYLEASGHLLMAMIRGNQLAGQVKQLQLKWKFETAMEQVRQMSQKAIREKLPANTGSTALTLASNVKPSSPAVTKLNQLEKVMLNQIKLDIGAAADANLDLINILIKYGHNSDGIPALHYSIKMNDEGAVKLLLEHGADPNSLSRQVPQNNHYDCSYLMDPLLPLDYAALSGNVKIIQVLIDHGANVEPPPKMINNIHSNSPHHIAVVCKSNRAFRVLLENTPDITTLISGPHYLLHLTASFGSSENLRLLIDRGAYVDIHQGDYTPLMQATGPCVELLLKAGANPTAKDRYGRDALSFLSYRCDLEGARALLKHKIDINAVRYDATPFQLACIQGGHPHVREYLHFLLDNGADINARVNGKTALSIARASTFDNKHELIAWLISHGAKE